MIVVPVAATVMVADAHARWWRLVPPVRSVGIVRGVGTIVGVVLVGSLSRKLPLLLLLLSGRLGRGMIIIQPVAVISSTGRRILDVAIPGSGRTSFRLLLGSLVSATMLLVTTPIILGAVSTSQVNGGTILSRGMRFVLLVVRAVHRWWISGLRMIGGSSSRRRRSRGTASTTTTRIAVGSSSSRSVVLRGRHAVTAGFVRMVLMLLVMMLSVRRRMMTVVRRRRRRLVSSVVPRCRSSSCSRRIRRRGIAGTATVVVMLIVRMSRRRRRRGVVRMLLLGRRMGMVVVVVVVGFESDMTLPLRC